MEALKHPLVAPRRATLVERLSLPYIDPVMLVVSVGLIGFSVFALAAVGRHELGGQPLQFATRQGSYGIAGIALMIALCRIDYARLRDLRTSIYAGALALAGVALVFGATARGADRWIELPYFRFQPAEFSKVLLCVSLAAFAFELARKRSRLRDTLMLMALGLAPAALVLLQPDLGTALVLAVGTAAVVFLAGVPWRHLVAVAAAAVLLAAGAFGIAHAAGIDPVPDYQEERLTAFLHPSEDPADASYQVNQSLIAVGSGEATGRGGDATQTELRFLPERHTDFIFAAIGERLGFAGVALLIGLYALLFWRALRVVRISESFYGTLIAGGIVAMLAFQVLVNVGMNLGMMPVTGIPLPLISYGGSSVIASFLALGVLQSIHVQSRRRERQPGAYAPAAPAKP